MNYNNIINKILIKFKGIVIINPKIKGAPLFDRWADMPSVVKIDEYKWERPFPNVKNKMSFFPFGNTRIASSKGVLLDPYFPN